MSVQVLAGSVVVLLCSLLVGTVVHELSHAVTLLAFGRPVDVDLLPDGDQGEGFSSPLAVSSRGSSILATRTSSDSQR